ncbi:hypothetical protein D521_2095 [beta proteobacterium CB]|nr:hypothetical protein D521_2095 [beta proteobacterium CB]
MLHDSIFYCLRCIIFGHRSLGIKIFLGLLGHFELFFLYPMS